jgi:hypothetical protein
VLIDESGPGAAVTHPVHQFAEACALVAGEIISGMPKVVEVETGQTRLCHGGTPLAREVAAPKLGTLWTDEDKSVRARPGESV